MPVNGLMVTLSADSDRAASALEAISSNHRLETGELQDRWLPLVTDVDDPKSSREIHGWLETLDGVDQVEVIMVSVDEPFSKS